MNKAQGRWLDASGLVLTTITLASTTLDACEPPYSLSDLRLRLYESAI
jgi:hypothetical protein